MAKVFFKDWHVDGISLPSTATRSISSSPELKTGTGYVSDYFTEDPACRTDEMTTATKSPASGSRNNMKHSSVLPALGLAVCTAACAQAAPLATSAFACPVKSMAGPEVEHQVVIDILGALNKAFDAALGPAGKHVDQPKVVNQLAATRVDETRMAALADISGCAALIDVRSSCSLYYDPELGDPLSVFMGMKTSAPLRKQFEAAIARLPDGEPKRAAQSCIKLVGHP